MTPDQIIAALGTAASVVGGILGLLWRSYTRAQRDLAEAQRDHAERIDRIHRDHADVVAALHKEHNATTAQVFTVLEPLSEALASMRRRTTR